MPAIEADEDVAVEVDVRIGGELGPAAVQWPAVRIVRSPMSVPEQKVYAGEEQKGDLRMTIAIRLAAGDRADGRDERTEDEDHGDEWG